MNEEKTLQEPRVPTRIAVYDDLLAAPRIVDIAPCDIANYIENITTETYRLAKEMGGEIPYTVIKEVCENFIHARFEEPCVSILDDGNTIKFTDQGPGIPDKQRAQEPAFTSATTEMRQYIRGVGSGFPTVREYLRFSNGRLIIEDNIQAGTVVTITLDKKTSQPMPVVYSETPPRSQYVQKEEPVQLSEREYGILMLAKEEGLIGPTEVNRKLGISAATAHRDMTNLEKAGLLVVNTGRKKRSITDKGLAALENQR